MVNPIFLMAMILLATAPLVLAIPTDEDTPITHEINYSDIVINETSNATEILITVEGLINDVSDINAGDITNDGTYISNLSDDWTVNFTTVGVERLFPIDLATGIIPLRPDIDNIYLSATALATGLFWTNFVFSTSFVRVRENEVFLSTSSGVGVLNTLTMTPTGTTLNGVLLEDLDFGSSTASYITISQPNAYGHSTLIELDGDGNNQGFLQIRGGQTNSLTSLLNDEIQLASSTATGNTVGLNMMNSDTTISNLQELAYIYFRGTDSGARIGGEYKCWASGSWGTNTNDAPTTCGIYTQSDGTGTALGVARVYVDHNGDLYATRDIRMLDLRVFTQGTGNDVRMFFDSINWIFDRNVGNGWVNFTDHIGVELKDMNFNQTGGNATINLIHAEMYNYSTTGNGFVVGLSVAGQYENLTNMSLNNVNGVGYTQNPKATGGSYFTILVAGIYDITFGMDAEVTAVGGVYGFSVAKNFDQSTSRNCYRRRELSANTRGNIPITCELDLAVGDTINVKVEDETNPPRDLNVETANLKIRRIAG